MNATFNPMCAALALNACLLWERGRECESTAPETSDELKRMAMATAREADAMASEQDRNQKVLIL